MSEAKPTFVLVSLQAEPAVPGEIAEALRNPGVPRSLPTSAYSTLQVAQLRTVRETALATFTTEGDVGEFCVDVETRAVVVLNRYGDIFPVNSSLGRFNDCVQAIIEAWPDWQSVSYPDECERITDEIKARIASIDEKALEYEVEGYWGTICDDLGMGNYI